MITKPVTQEQLKHWKMLFDKYASKLKPNRISGIALETYFQHKYKPQPFDDEEFKEVVRLNAQAYDSQYDEKDIHAYKLGQVYIGIAVDTGFFHVECEEVEKCIPLYDDLFVAWGLSEKDLQNYVLVGQYLELTGNPTVDEGHVI